MPGCKRSRPNEKPTSHIWRVAPACHNQREKPPQQWRPSTAPHTHTKYKLQKWPLSLTFSRVIQPLAKTILLLGTCVISRYSKIFQTNTYTCYSCPLHRCQPTMADAACWLAQQAWAYSSCNNTLDLCGATHCCSAENLHFAGFPLPNYVFLVTKLWILEWKSKCMLHFPKSSSFLQVGAWANFWTRKQPTLMTEQDKGSWVLRFMQSPEKPWPASLWVCFFF